MVTVADVDMRNWFEHPDGVVYDGNYPLSARPGAGTLNINDSLHGLASDNMVLFTGRQNLIFEDLFDGGTLDLNRYYGSGNTPEVKTIVGGALDGQSVLEVFLDHDNSTTSYRTEVVSEGWAGTTGFSDNISASYGATLWYGMSVYIPSDFVLDTGNGSQYTGREIITQWHGRPDTGEDNSRNPMIGLEIDNDTYRIYIKGDSNALFTGSYTRSNSYNLATTVTSTIGKWTNWVWRIKWGYNNDGELDLYRDGVLQHSEVNQSNCYNDQDNGGPYLKFGVYKWPWRPTRPDTSTQTRLYYFDNFRVGNSNATLSDVWEDHL